MHLVPTWLKQAVHHPIAPVHALLISDSKYGGNCAPQFQTHPFHAMLAEFRSGSCFCVAVPAVS